ncbi:MAG: fasciclin domain-containing protein [Rhodospirillaceae bacterium]
MFKLTASKTLMAAVVGLGVAFAPAAFVSTAQAGGMKGEQATMIKGDIVDTAVGAGSFNTLVAAVQAAGLVETLKGPGPFTVFAPTDEAFGALKAGTVESLLKPQNRDKLTAILTYHVIPGRVMAPDIIGQSLEAQTVGGPALPIDASGTTIKVGGATVISSISAVMASITS